ncbi:MAG TPA: nuclear transport factor 2 family protein [Bacteroidia bacterium]|nr:nuclear transport factor 2 family protein [Bacteroidia bacterium]
MSTLEATKAEATKKVANRLVELCRQGKNADAVKELYAENIVSVEPKGARAERTEGKTAVLAKSTQWQEMIEKVHSSATSDPIVTDNFFSCVMEMDVTLKGMGRMPMNEIAVYEVKDGKIVFEQFFFNVPH